LTIYEELLRAAQTGRFAPQMIGELEHVYLSRLAMAASVVTDEEWNRLSKGAADWCNAAAIRINSGLVMDLKCPGFNEIPVTIERIPDSLRGMGIEPGGYIDGDGKFQITEFSLVDNPQDPSCRVLEAEAHFPPKHHNTPLDIEEVASLNDDEEDAPKLPPIKTDLIRACVIEHPDWLHPQIMAYLGAGANPNTVSTVRSITLATMNIARSLGKWRD
jgi:hypothetical protein